MARRYADDPELLVRESMGRRLSSRSATSGEIVLPAVPGMVDDYVAMCGTVFATLGRPFSVDELANFKTVLQSHLAEAFTASPRSDIVISYSAAVGAALNYNVNTRWWTIAEGYENWVATQEPPYFGTEPDARVWALVNEADDPTTRRVLDIGAGTGRNALALARRGHPVDVVEVTPKFADVIELEAQRDSLDVSVIQRDAFSTMEHLRHDYWLILLSGVVSDFRTTQQLRAVFELAAQCLAPGGRLVFNAFLPREGHTLDDAARALGQQMFTSIFTREEMSNAAADLPLGLVGDDSVHEYEKAHLPDGAWPPTNWYLDWISGLDVFDVERESSPIEMRWRVYQKLGVGL